MSDAVNGPAKLPLFEHDRPDHDLTARRADRAVLVRLRRFLAGIHAISETPDKREVGGSSPPRPITTYGISMAGFPLFIPAKCEGNGPSGGFGGPSLGRGRRHHPRRLRGRRPRGWGACPRQAGVRLSGRCPERCFGDLRRAGSGPLAGPKPAHATFNVAAWRGDAAPPSEPRLSGRCRTAVRGPRTPAVPALLVADLPEAAPAHVLRRRVSRVGGPGLITPTPLAWDPAGVPTPAPWRGSSRRCPLLQPAG